MLCKSAKTYITPWWMDRVAAFTCAIACMYSTPVLTVQVQSSRPRYCWPTPNATNIPYTNQRCCHPITKPALVISILCAARLTIRSKNYRVFHISWCSNAFRTFRNASYVIFSFINIECCSKLTYYPHIRNKNKSLFFLHRAVNTNTNNTVFHLSKTKQKLIDIQCASSVWTTQRISN